MGVFVLCARCCKGCASCVPRRLPCLALHPTTAKPHAPGCSFQLTQPALFTALSVYTLVWAALAALEAQSGFERVGSAVGPAFLAVNALGGLNGAIPPFADAAAGFGVFLVSWRQRV